MIFKPELAAKVLDGRKTITRRRINPNGVRYHSGRWYKVQPGRGKFHVCHIFVTAVHTQTLGAVSDADAAREGFPVSRLDFIDYWKRINGGFDPDERIAVIEWSREMTYTEDCCAELEAR